VSEKLIHCIKKTDTLYQKVRYSVAEDSLLINRIGGRYSLN